MTLYLEQKYHQILKAILEKYDYSFFAFGPRASCNNNKLSDLNIFFIEEIPAKELLKIQKDFEESDLPFKVNIVDFGKCDESLQKTIQQNYICLKSSSKLQIIEQNHLGHFVHLPQRLGFHVHQTANVTIINCGLKTSMFNIAYGAPNNCDLMIEQVKKIYNKHPFAWWIPPSQHNTNITKSLIENGFVIETVEHAMICDLSSKVSLEQKTNLIIKIVTESSLLKSFISVLEPYDSYVSDFYNLVDNDLLQENEKLFVGYVGAKPVTIGVLFILGSSAGIFSLVTTDDSRGLGYGTDMMVFLMKFAKDHGCKSVTLSASSDSGYRIYERLGFIKIGEFECFEYSGNQS